MAAFFRYPLVLMVLGIIAVAVGIAIAGALGRLLPDAANTSPAILLPAIFAAVGAAAAYWLFVRYAEGVPVKDFALAGSVRELALGMAVGAGAFTAVVGVAWALGLYRITGYNSWQTVWGMLAIAIVSSVTEEILFRGVLFRYVEAAAGSAMALFISSALFGLAHIMNPNSSWIAAFAIAIEAGIMLGAIYMLTRRLWAAIGLHAAWNFTQGWVWGVPISGTNDPGYAIGRLEGPELLTGGGFGLEASVIAMIIATAVGLICLLFAIRRGEWRAFGHRRASLAAQTKL